MEAERQADERRQQAARLEQVARARREEKLTERLAAAEQREKELRAREQATREREKATADAAARYEQLRRRAAAANCSAWPA